MVGPDRDDLAGPDLLPPGFQGQDFFRKGLSHDVFS
jgi:hypothetical protein